MLIHILASDQSRYIGRFSAVSDSHTLSLFFLSVAKVLARSQAKSIFRSVS